MRPSASYLNIFKMNGNPEVMHGIAAGLRAPVNDQTDPHGQPASWARAAHSLPCHAKHTLGASCEAPACPMALLLSIAIPARTTARLHF